MLHSTSESAIIALVVLISFGWTLTYNSGNQLDLYLPLIGCLGFLNIVVTMITKVGHSYDRHHVFDNVGGTILVGFRCIIILIFIWGCIRTYRRVRHNLKKFMLRFSILGFVCIASMPTIVGIANYFISEHKRELSQLEENIYPQPFNNRVQSCKKERQIIHRHQQQEQQQ